jgi:hypothetical protein
MIEGDFDTRTLANMNVTLERVCGQSPIGERHELRKRVAQSIVSGRLRRSSPSGASKIERIELHLVVLFAGQQGVKI